MYQTLGKECLLQKNGIEAEKMGISVLLIAVSQRRGVFEVSWAQKGRFLRQACRSKKSPLIGPCGPISRKAEEIAKNAASPAIARVLFSRNTMRGKETSPQPLSGS